MKQNLLHWILPHQDFVSFIKLLNSLDEFSLFLGDLKSVFSMRIGSEQERIH